MPNSIKLTKEETEIIFKDWIDNLSNRHQVEKKYCKWYIIKKYLLEYNICTIEEIKEIQKRKTIEATRLGIKNNRRSYKGENGTFYGKQHTEESKQKLREINLGKHDGDKNRFFGKKHPPEIMELIKEKLRINAKKEDFNLKNFQRLNISIEELKLIFEDYVSNKVNQAYIEMKYKLTFRTLERYFKYFKIIENEEEYKILKKRKQSAISMPEEIIYQKLCFHFNPESVKRQYKISSYRYDFLLDDKYLIEFDGKYWHSFEIAKKRDKIKNTLAEHYNFILFRINEKTIKNYDYEQEVLDIKEKINEIQTQKNRNN